jgi:hypothetical protein
VLGPAGDLRYTGPLDWAGRRRYVLFLPHPNARGVPKGVAAYLGLDSQTVLPAIRGLMSEVAGPRRPEN